MPLSHVKRYDQRLRRLTGLMTEAGMDFLVLFNPINQYYVSGAAQNGVLVLPVSGNPVYLVRRNLDEARRDSWLSDVRQLSGVEDGLASIASELGISRCVVGIEYNLTSVALFKKLESVFDGVRFSDCSSVMLEARKIKEPEEIECIREAVRLSDLLFAAVAAVFHEGITELDLSADMDCLAKKQGSEGIAIFYDFGGRAVIWRPGNSRITSGPEAAIPADWPIVGGQGLSKAASHGPSRKRIMRGEQVSIDMGTIIEGYHADEGRTFFVGPPSAKLREMYEAALAIELTFIDNAKPGESISQAMERALEVARRSGYLDNLMGPPPLNHLMIGHGVGLFTNEFPLLMPKTTQVFEPGIVFAVEPKVVVPGVGSVEVEDTVLVLERGNEVLSRFPKNLEAVIL